MVDHWVL